MKFAFISLFLCSFPDPLSSPTPIKRWDFSWALPSPTFAKLHWRSIVPVGAWWQPGSRITLRASGNLVVFNTSLLHPHPLESGCISTVMSLLFPTDPWIPIELLLICLQSDSASWGSLAVSFPIKCLPCGKPQKNHMRPSEINFVLVLDFPIEHGEC